MSRYLRRRRTSALIDDGADVSSSHRRIEECSRFGAVNGCRIAACAPAEAEAGPTAPFPVIRDTMFFLRHLGALAAQFGEYGCHKASDPSLPADSVLVTGVRRLEEVERTWCRSR